MDMKDRSNFILMNGLLFKIYTYLFVTSYLKIGNDEITEIV